MTSFTTRRPVAVGVVFLAAVVFGGLSYLRLPVTLMPEISYPTLTVRTEYPGAAPEEVENDISRPIEEALGVVGGLRKISSISRADVSDVVLELSWDTDMSEAVQDTLEKLDLVFLPDDAERPLILRFDPSLDPVMELSLSGEGDRFEGDAGLRRLRRIAELQVKRELEPVTGVAAVQVRGGLEEEINVDLDEEQLRRTGISIQEVIDRLRQENINVAGGTIKEGRTEYMVRTLNEFRSLEQIERTVIASIDGRDVRLADLGQVRMAQKDREILTRTDGAESVQLDIFKEADANVVALSRRIQQRLGELDLASLQGEPSSEEEEGEAGQEGKPVARGLDEKPAGLAAELYRNEGVRLQVAADRSVFIESSIDNVRSAAIFGGLLAVIVLYLFLRSFRTTAIVAISIPASLLMAFAPINIAGISLNIMSLGGLALGIGMLVDSSIVVLESIFRCREEGDELVSSVVRGTDEVRGAVTASTLTSIAVFAPMVFIEGIAGQAFGDLGLAVVVSLLASLMVALYLIPMLASLHRKQGIEQGTREGPGLWSFPSLVRLRSDGKVWWSFLRSSRYSTRVRALVLPLKVVAALVWGLYLLLRGLLTLVLELVGRILLLLALAIVFLGQRLGLPALRYCVRFLEWGPLRVVHGTLSMLQEGYRRALSASLARPAAVMMMVAATFALTFWMLEALDTELLPEVHQGEITVEVALPVGLPLEETVQTLTPVEEAILAEKEHIERLAVTFGFDAANTGRSDEGEHTARFKVLLESSDPHLEEIVIRRLRGKFAAIPDLEARVVRPVLFSFKTPIEVEVHGDHLGRLRDYSERVTEVMADMPELADVQSTLRAGAPEVQIVYDRDRLARYGLDLSQVAQLVRNEVKGFEATRYNLRDRRIPIMVRLEEEDRRSVEDVSELLVNPGGDLPIRLSSVAAIELGEGPSEVRRVDARRVALVRANIAQGSLGHAVQRIEQELSTGVDWPADMTFLIAGQQEEWERSVGSLWLAMGLSIFLVYVIMAAQFESLLHPLVILFSIPLAFFGTVLTLRILSISLSIVVFLGMIMLAGIVVNNAIVLVDYINTLRRRGMPRDEAIRTAGMVRLRPILMTTATTVLGLLPMSLGIGDGAEIRTPMAIAVISGLITSTALTLVVIPVLYALLDRMKVRLVGGETEVAIEKDLDQQMVDAAGLHGEGAAP